MPEHLTQAQQELYRLGRQRYQTCLSCHGPDGPGIIGPALSDSAWVQGEPSALIRIVLQGFDGGAAERGEEIPEVMPPHGYLSDEQLAAVLTYIRQSWGHGAGPIAPEQVARVRQQTEDRAELWSPDELRAVLDER